MPGAFDTFQNTFNTSMQLLLKKKAMDQEAQQFQAVMGQKKMELAQEAEQAKNKIAADEFSGKVKTLGTMLEKAHEYGDTKMVNWLAPRYEALSGIPQPKTQDGYLTLSKETDQLTLDKLTAQALQNNDLPLLERISNLKKAGATKVTTNVGGKAEPTNEQIATAEAFKNFGKETPERLKLYSENARAASNTINTMEALEKSIEGLDFGAETPAMMEIAKWGRVFGVDIDPNLPQKQQAKAFLNQIALQFRNPAGGAGMPGHLSDQDRKFLIEVAGNLSMEPEAIKNLIRIRKKLANRQIDEATEAERYVKEHGYLGPGFSDRMAKWSKENPLFSGSDTEALKKPAAEKGSEKPTRQNSFAEMPSPAEYTGRELRDTDSGKKYKSNGTEWVEVK